MTKPAVDTTWCDQLSYLPVIDKDGNPQVVPNKQEPTIEYKLYGAPPPPFPLLGDCLNYKLNADHQMIQWLTEKEVGTVLTFNNTLGYTSSSVQDLYGGTWVDRGTESLFGITIRAFEKTA